MSQFRQFRIILPNGRKINGEFIAQASLAFEGQGLYPVDMDALTDVSNPEYDQVNTDVLNMMDFMYKSGCMLGIKWGDKFYFGDVDLMDEHDNYLADEGTICIQLELEDEPTAESLYGLFTQVNKDCAGTAESVVPFTDIEYYSIQIQILFDLSEERATELANELASYKEEN